MTSRIFAGVHSDRQAPRAASPALRPWGRVASHRSRKLSVAWSGADRPAERPGSATTLCVLDGWVEGLDERGLAALYESRGEDFLRDLRGDFALLLWDTAADEGILARDHLGSRSLFWTERGGRLYFASELTPLLAVMEQRPGPDSIALLQWINAAMPRERRTLFEGVRPLRPGHLLARRTGRWEERRYWAPSYERPLCSSREELVEEARSLVVRAVKRRCRGGERVGIMLSGGLDSSSVAAVAQRALGVPALSSAYSATFPGHRQVDESDLIEVLTAELALPGRRVAYRDGGVLHSALDEIRVWSVPPLAPSSAFERPLLRSAAADGIDVMLDGDGGDEVFGERIFLIADLLRRGRPLAALQKVGQLPGLPRPHPLAKRLGILVLLGSRAAVPYRLHEAIRCRQDPGRYAPDWLRAESAARLFPHVDEWAWKRERGPRWWAYHATALARGMIDAVGLLDHVRRRAKTAGLEARHPLLDVDLIEFALRLPPEVTFDPRATRALLRDSMSGILPDALRLRRGKSYFDPVMSHAIETELPAIRALLGARNAEVGAYVHLDVVRDRLLAEPPRGHHDRVLWWNQLWRLVTAECWLRSQADRGWTESYFFQLDEFPSRT